MHPMENKSWGKAHVITLHRERGQLKFQDTRWGEKEEQEGSRERKYKVQGPMLTRWPQLHEQTSPVFHLNAHLETGHTEPPHLRISSRKKKTRHFLTYLLCISCLFTSPSSVLCDQCPRHFWTRQCLCVSDWFRPRPRKVVRPRGQGSRSGPMDLGHHVNWVHCSYYCSSLKAVIFQHAHSSFSDNQVVSSYPPGPEQKILSCFLL